MASGAAAAALAFDRIAPRYDESFGRNPAALLFRHVFQERLRRLFPAGARVLDLGCGTGDDALFLASLGVRVHALDIAPEMVARTREKAERAGLAERVHVEERAAEDVASAGSGFDGAFSDFGALNCAALGAVGEGLARALRPGAPLMRERDRPLAAARARRARVRGNGSRAKPLAPGGRRWSCRRDTSPSGSCVRRSAPPLPGAAPSHWACSLRGLRRRGGSCATRSLSERWPRSRGSSGAGRACANLGDHVVVEGARR